MRRTRAVLVAAALAAGVLALSRLPQGPALTFADMPGAPGFRLAQAGGVSAGRAIDPLAGIGGAAGPVPDRAALCAALAAPGVARGPADAPRVLVLTDHRCPNCRAMEPALTALADSGAARVETLFWPLFGPPSALAARAALAAAAQDGGSALHARLMRSSFVPTEAYLAEAARLEGLDPDRLRRDMAGPQVAASLAAGPTLARGLGLIGAPAVVVGRMVAQGALDGAQLRALLAAEAAADGPPPCAAAG
jgi:protein-disulfide isomerase